MPSPAISFSSSIAKDHKPIPQSTNSTHLIYLNPTHLGHLSISLTLIPCHISKCLLSLFFILFLSTPLPQAVFPTMLLRKDIRFLNFLVTSPLYLKKISCPHLSFHPPSLFWCPPSYPFKGPLQSIILLSVASLISSSHLPTSVSKNKFYSSL